MKLLGSRRAGRCRASRCQRPRLIAEQFYFPPGATAFVHQREMKEWPCGIATTVAIWRPSNLSLNLLCLLHRPIGHKPAPQPADALSFEVGRLESGAALGCRRPVAGAADGQMRSAAAAATRAHHCQVVERFCIHLATAAAAVLPATTCGNQCELPCVASYLTANKISRGDVIRTARCPEEVGEPLGSFVVQLPSKFGQ